MSFASPTFLLGLLVVPVLLGLYVLSRRRRARYAIRYPATATVACGRASASTRPARARAKSAAGRWRAGLGRGTMAATVAAAGKRIA